MIGKVKQLSGSAGGPLNYMMGGKLEKDQEVTVIDYDGIALSNRMIQDIQLIPKTPAEKRKRKKRIWEIAQKLAAVFDARASMADDRVKNPNEEYIISYSPEDNDKLSIELRRKIDLEFLQKMGVHGDIEVRRKRKSEVIVEKQKRNSLFLICAHDGTNANHEHIYFSRIGADGKATDIRNERRRALKAAREISKKYGLHLRLNGKEVCEENGYTICKKEYTRDRQKANSGINLRDDIKAAVEDCVARTTTFDELEKELMDKGILVTYKKHSETDIPYGIVFTKITGVRNHKDKEPGTKETTYSGSQLSHNLTYGKIAKVLEANKVAKKKPTMQIKESVVTPSIVSIPQDPNEARWEELRRIIYKFYKNKETKFSFAPAEEGDSFWLTINRPGKETITTKVVCNELRFPDGSYIDFNTEEYVKAETIHHPSSRVPNAEQIAELLKLASEDGSIQKIIDYINSKHFDKSAEYHVVPGTMEPIPEGMRLNLVEDGNTSDGVNIYPLQLEIAPIHGKRYIDFTFNADGHLVAHIELDPNDYYSYGRQGDFNLVTGKRTLSPREYRGTPEEYAQKQAKQSVLPKKKSKKFGKGI